MPDNSSSLLIAGCYERFLFGFKCSPDNEAASLVRTFNYPAHKGSVKCIAAAGSIVASGGADDLIHIYDMHKGRDLGYLMNPGDGAVTALAFYQAAEGAAPSHLLNGSSDGSISVWQGSSWDCLKTMEGHKGAVNSLSVHPNGSVALSVGRDRELRVWNLTKGKVTYHSKLASEADLVAFHPDGDKYVLMVDRAVTMHGLAGGGEQLADMPHPSRVLSACFCGRDGILTGCEDGSLRLWDTRCSRPVAEVLRAHATRVKGVAAVGAAAADFDRDGDGGTAEPLLAASASSDGIVRLWDMRTATSHRPLAEVSTSARLACLVAASPSAPQPAAQQPAATAEERSSARRKTAADRERGGTPSQPAGDGSKVQKKQRQQQQRRQQEAADVDIHMRPKAKQKVKVRGKQRETRAAAAPEAAATAPAAAGQGAAPAKKRKKGPGSAAAASAKPARKPSKHARDPTAAAAVPGGDRGVAKRGLVEFAPEDYEAADGSGAVQKPKHKQQRQGGQTEGGRGKQQLKVQLQNLNRFD